MLIFSQVVGHVQVREITLAAADYSDWQESTDAAERLSRLRGRITYLSAMLGPDMGASDQRVGFQWVQTEIARLSAQETRLDGLSAITDATAPGGRSKMVFRTPD